MNHTHPCADCGHESPCDQKVDRRGRCQVDKAARVNKQGPYCDLCRHLEMARRYAAARSIELRIWRSDQEASV